MIDLNSLVLFAKIVDAGSFSEAARRLGMPISTVSRRLAELEDGLGVRLLERSTRSLRLTEIGAEVIHQAKRGAVLCDAVSQTITESRDSSAGNLCVSAPPSISASVLTALALRFQSRYPDVHIRILTTDRCVDHIEDGVDVAFAFGSLKSSSLVAQRILTYCPQLFASPEYLAENAAPKTPLEITAHRLVANSNTGSPNIWSLTNSSTSNMITVDIEPCLVTSEFTSLTSALLSGMGIGSHFLKDEAELLRSGRLERVLPDWHLPSCTLSLVYLGHRNLSNAIRNFKEFALETIPLLFGSSEFEIPPYRLPLEQPQRAMEV